MDIILSQLATNSTPMVSLDKILNCQNHYPTFTNVVFHRASLDDHSGVDGGDRLSDLIWPSSTTHSTHTSRVCYKLIWSSDLIFLVDRFRFCMTLIALLSPSKIALQRLGYVYFWEGPRPGTQIPSHQILPTNTQVLPAGFFRRTSRERGSAGASGKTLYLLICLWVPSANECRWVLAKDNLKWTSQMLR